MSPDEDSTRLTIALLSGIARRSHEPIRRALLGTDTASTLRGPDMRAIDVNEAMLHFLQLTREEVIGQLPSLYNWYTERGGMLVSAEPPSVTARRLNAPHCGRYVLVREYFEMQFVHMTATPLPRGEMLIQLRPRYEQAGRDGAAEDAPDTGIVRFDHQLRVIDANPLALALAGIGIDDLRRSGSVLFRAADRFGKPIPRSRLAPYEARRMGTVYRAVYELTNSAGFDFLAQVVATPLEDDGVIVRFNMLSR